MILRRAAGGWGDILFPFMLAAALAAGGVARADVAPDVARADTPAESLEAGIVPADGQAPDVEVRVWRGPAGLEVEGRCAVRATSAEVWAVLTDYDGISRFVSSMRESRVSGRGEGYLLVDQIAVGRLFLFSKQMHARLRVAETPTTAIHFEDVLGRDFTTYVGDWTLDPAPSGTRIVYRVTARPTFSVPDVIVRGMFKRTARDLLRQVAAEIGRRAAAARAANDERTPPAAADGE
ncbi:MAG: SRPBCC family protein, partial [Candidatus Eisenbacteria bacterium]|nr:SRPBCC family protein [Candidatus Eisenbacteria bacterium]